jgi:hypothetical protein
VRVFIGIAFVISASVQVMHYEARTVDHLMDVVTIDGIPTFALCKKFSCSEASPDRGSAVWMTAFQF